MGCWNGAQWATVIAVGLSSAMLIICLTLVGQMRQDMSNLYTEFMDDMQEFNTITNDAWTEIMAMSTPPSGRIDSISAKLSSSKKDAEKAFDSFFYRTSRHALPDICACAASIKRPNKCPPGPKGPKGADGPNGIPGDNGAPGPKGMNGKELAGLLYPPNECIKCPAGPIGEPGREGRQGPPGPQGASGAKGGSVPQGPKGQPGPPGDEGEGGPDGIPGPRGKPGLAGIHGKAGEKGPKGPPGEQGWPGPNGDAAPHGEHGKPGSSGPPGSIGQAGNPGKAGIPGPVGSVGEPGIDAQYCPCPTRGVVVESAKQNTEYNRAASLISRRFAAQIR